MIAASIYGRLGADPQERTTRNGSVMATASVAVNTALHGADEDTEWFGIAAFGSTAKVLLGHAKGDLISAMGKLHRRRYTGRDGTEREGWSLTAEAILSARTTRPGGGRKRDAAQKPDAAADGTTTADEPNDDIPF